MTELTKMILIRGKDRSEVISEIVSEHIPKVDEYIRILVDGITYKFRVSEISYEIVKDVRKNSSGYVSANYCDVIIHCEREHW